MSRPPPFNLKFPRLTFRLWVDAHTHMIKRYLLLAVLVFLPVLFHLHGFSITCWRTNIDGSHHQEVLLGEARGIRSDDYVAVLPHILSQIAHRPPFPARSTIIGDGNYDMQLNYSLPVLGPITLFRPQLWGYFISPDLGLSWNWWFYVFGTWIVLFFILRRASGDRWLIPACGATAMLYSPFFQYWSLNCAPSVIYAGCLLLASLHLYEAQSRRSVWFSSAALTWSGLAFFLTFGFTPYIVTLFYLALFIFGGFAVRDRNKLVLQTRRDRWMGLLMALGLVAFLAYIFIGESRDTLEIVKSSMYPGHRFCYGGDARAADVFAGNAIGILRPRNFGGPDNLSGEASFFLFSPLVALLILLDWIRTRVRPNPLQIALLLYLTLAMLWQFRVFPEEFCRWTLLDRVPTRRARIGIGIADLLLLATYLSTRVKDRSFFKFKTAAPWLASILWLGFIGVVSWPIFRAFPGVPLRSWILSCGATTLLGWSIIAWPRLTLPALAIVSIASTCWFNPLVRGGTDFIYSNPLSRTIMDIDWQDRREGKSSVWIAYGRDRYDIHIPNLFRMLGVRSLNGVHAYPQKDFWKKLDPNGSFSDVWNRYAHVRFSLPPNRQTFDIQLVQNDLVLVLLHPEDPRFADLNVDYLVYTGKEDDLDGIWNLTHLYSYAGKHIYRVH